MNQEFATHIEVDVFVPSRRPTIAWVRPCVALLVSLALRGVRPPRTLLQELNLIFVFHTRAGQQPLQIHVLKPHRPKVDFARSHLRGSRWREGRAAREPSASRPRYTNCLSSSLPPPAAQCSPTASQRHSGLAWSAGSSSAGQHPMLRTTGRLPCLRSGPHHAATRLWQTAAWFTVQLRSMVSRWKRPNHVHLGQEFVVFTVGSSLVDSRFARVPLSGLSSCPQGTCMTWIWRFSSFRCLRRSDIGGHKPLRTSLWLHPQKLTTFSGQHWLRSPRCIL